MPIPVSLTATSRCELTRSSRTWTLPPRFVNFTAFESRFHNTCCRRSGSPDTGAACGSSTVSIRTPLASAAGVMASTALRTISGMKNDGKRLLEVLIAPEYPIGLRREALRTLAHRQGGEFLPARHPADLRMRNL